VDTRTFRPGGKIPGDGTQGADSSRGTDVTKTKGTTVFLSVFQWQQRKGPDVLLKAYWNAFRKDDDVVLRVRAKVPGWGGNPFKTAQGGVKHWARALWNTSPDQLAKVEVVTARDGEDATREDMAGECIFISAYGHLD
jgi:hypothetical protein